MLNLHIVIIDPQMDFCDPNGALYVPGAEEDMKRLAKMVERLTPKITDIHVTMDSHRKVDISHPMWWRDAQGNMPNPFTIITAQDVKDGTWRTFIPSHQPRTLAYLVALEASGRYPHCIWPEHCLIGSGGHSIVPDFLGALHHWEEKRYAQTDLITKGSNPWTEHFSGVQAEVPDPEDPSTQLNIGLVETLEQADEIAIAGEALSHCLANTGRDIVKAFSDPSLARKITLIEDGASNVTGFDNFGDDFIRELTAQGMRVSKAEDFLR